MSSSVTFLDEIARDGLALLQEYRMLIVGLSMVLIMVWRPRGLISTRHPSVLLRERKGKGAPAELLGEGRG